MVNSKFRKLVAKQGCKPKKSRNNEEYARRALLGQLKRVHHYRYGPVFPDDSAGREDLELICKVHALHPTHGREMMKNAIETWAPWMPKETAQYLIDDLAGMDRRRL